MFGDPFFDDKQGFVEAARSAAGVALCVLRIAIDYIPRNENPEISTIPI